MTVGRSSQSAKVTLPADDQLLITREFAAPKHLVYRAITEPDLIKRWWNAKRGEVTLCEHDVEVGGRWRQVMVTPDGFEVGFRGKYHEIVPNERIVSTEIYEGAPGVDPDDYEGGSVNTLTLTESNGRTTMTVLCRFPSKEVRDMVIESGMEAGMQDAYDLLEEVAVSLR
jgi:uncharacterized protein YndB with AHSA1/START domain